MSMAIRSAASKALQSAMAKAKKSNDQAKIEWEMSCNTSNQRGHVWDQSELKNLYSRDDFSAGRGATKTCHLKCHNNNDFEYIVVKRHQTYGYIDEHQFNPDFYHTGNQLVDEIRCWEKFAKTAESDYLCPILKYFTSKSDQVTATSETMQDNVLIIAQKAVYVSSLKQACMKAAELNGESIESAKNRYYEMKKFADDQGWRDAVGNNGNSGVIIDYSTNEFKAVFIDYAL